MEARQRIDLYATLGDMKDVACQNSMAICALIDLLVAKGLITREEIAQQARRLDTASEVYQSGL